MTEIRAVLFDCDGLMFNTEQVSQQMWRDEAAKYGEECSDEFFKAITGAKDGIDLLHFSKETPHIKEIMEVMHKKRFDLEFWKSFYPDGLNKKGLVELVQYLHEKDIRIAVCSSSHYSYVKTLLDTVTCDLGFDAIVGGDMVLHGKPAPDIFLLGAKTLNVKPEECLVLEDSKQGIIAADNAHMHSVFIKDTITPDEEMKKYLDYEEEDLGKVITLIEEEFRK